MKPLYTLLALVGSSLAIQPQQQQVFSSSSNDHVLHGRYLHITDIHVNKPFTKRVNRVKSNLFNLDGQTLCHRCYDPIRLPP
jgi:hypothetical protein